MRKHCLPVILGFLVLTLARPALAQPLLRVSAHEAFDAYAAQTDPASGELARVILVDVRTRAEYYWVGTGAMVDRIVLSDGTELNPDDGRVLAGGGEGLLLTINGALFGVLVADIESLETRAIFVSVPYLLWDETTASNVPNLDFFDQIAALADGDPSTVLILMCRSGKRSESAPLRPEFPWELFRAVYEIDRPDKSALGGFQGSSYDDAYNGQRGYPGRWTYTQSHPSMSWLDAGLPIKIGVTP
jgi:rhodanese-related sulfurtransferase